MLVRTIELVGEEIEIQQNTTSGRDSFLCWLFLLFSSLVFEGELGATVWDCALVIIQAFLAKQKLWKQYFDGKRVLDMSWLGSFPFWVV